VLPSIAGVITTPTMRPDGSILSAPGYDPITRLFHVADPALVMPSIPNRPTREDADRALDYLSRLLAGFPFVDVVADRAVALAALITPVVRGAMPVAPLFAIRATTAGTGKSYLVDLASAVSTGRLCPVISAGKDEVETEKRLGGLLLEGFPILSLDNVNGELGGDFICQAVERPLVRVRRLGVSDITEVESRATMYATGNGLRIQGDLVRRTLLCTLDANVERPELREFDTDPVQMVLDDRGRYVAAALTIVRAFQVSGAATLKPLASFEQWSDTVRSALAWLECGDPCATMETARDEDPELAELREIMTLWTDAIGSDEVTCRKAIEIATSVGPKIDDDGEADQYGPSVPRHPDFANALLGVAASRGVIDSARLGNWLTGQKGRIVDGLRFERAGTTGGSARWKVAKLGKVG
jgi:putative DNA primase/helicase